MGYKTLFEQIKAVCAWNSLSGRKNYFRQILQFTYATTRFHPPPTKQNNMCYCVVG